MTHLGIVLVVKPNKGKASRPESMKSKVQNDSRLSFIPASPPFSWQVDVANIAKLLEKRLQVLESGLSVDIVHQQRDQTGKMLSAPLTSMTTE